MNNFLGKSNGLTLINHSEIVSKTASLLLLRLVGDSNVDRYSETINITCKLHDIGKLTNNFQKFLNGKITSPKLKFRHNEIGWAVISYYLSDTFPNKNIISNSVYWHHGISNKINGHTDSDILKTLSQDDINTMIDYMGECVGRENIVINMFKDSVRTPLFYDVNDVKLTQLMLCRSILITSDRISSNYSNISQIDDAIIDEYLLKKKNNDLSGCIFNGNERFESQKEIVKKTTKTNIINAPAGFGKTMMGLLWCLPKSEKTIWVTPRNIVAESAYYSVMQDCESLKVTPSIQLILGGEIKKTNTPLLDKYDADIIITNIDNFLTPSFKNDIMDESSLLFGANVIFDEYHELVTKAPLMSLFIYIMRVRHQLTNSKTLLLSATGFNIEELWEDSLIDNKTTILPKKNEHYTAQHNKKYLLNVVTDIKRPLPNTTSFVIKNTIKSSQDEKLIGGYKLLLHSQFLEEKKEKDFNFLIENYNKISEVKSDKPNVLGTHVIQAALDISCKFIYEDVFSPQFSLQRFGRCNRWGEYGDESVINVFRQPPTPNSTYCKSENIIKELLYSRNLSDAWFDELLPYNGKHITLNELYIIFNSFNYKYNVGIVNFIKSNFSNSKKHLSKLYPVKFNKPNKKTDVKTAGSNKLRSVNNELFYIVKHHKNNEWVGTFTKEILTDLDILFNETSNIKRKMEKVMKELRNLNDNRFKYNDILNNPNSTIDSIRRFSKRSDTPYIVFDRVYNDELGIISNDTDF